MKNFNLNFLMEFVIQESCEQIYRVLRNTCFVKKRISETWIRSGLFRQLSFRHRYISSGIKAVPAIPGVQRQTMCTVNGQWPQNRRFMGKLFLSNCESRHPHFLWLAELVAKKYYYRRIACEYAETCFHFRSRVLSQQCVRYTADIYYR